MAREPASHRPLFVVERRSMKDRRDAVRTRHISPEIAAALVDAKWPRWKATVVYRSERDLVNVEFFLRELEDLDDHIAPGPHWDTIHHITIKRVNHIESPTLTVEQAAKL